MESQTFPQFLADFRAGKPGKIYASTAGRTLERAPPIRRDLIQRRRYLVPNSILVTRGCPQHCDFCYKDAFFEGGAASTRSVWTVTLWMTPLLEAVPARVSRTRLGTRNRAPKPRSTPAELLPVLGQERG